MALAGHVDRDLVASMMAMAGISPEEISRLVGRAGASPQVIWDTIRGRDLPDSQRKALDLAERYMTTLSGGDLQKLLVEGHGLPESVVSRAIRSSSSGDTIASVLKRLASDNTQYVNKASVRQYVAGVLGTTQTLGLTGLNKSKQQYMSPVASGNLAPLKSNTGGLLSGVTPMPGTKKPPNPPGAGLSNIMRRAKVPGAPSAGGETLGNLGTLGDGAGDGSGTTTAAATVPAAPPPLASTASDAEVEAYIRNNFGFAAWALDEPEIRQVLVDFTRDMRGYEFTADQLESKLLGTQWWQDKNKNARARIREKNEDPATYNQGILNEAEKLRLLMEQPGRGGGFNINANRLQEMARTSYKMGWTNAEMRAALAAEFDYDPTGGSQTASALVGRLKTLAGQYLVPLSEATIDEWGRAMIAGTANEDTINGYLREQAKVLLPAFAAQIDAGLTPSALVEPYRQTIAREMGSNPSEIDFLDPKWNRFISHRDPKTGQPVAMDPYEIQKTIRTDSTYGWDQTAGARSQATEFITKLAERFGKAG